MKKIEVDGEKRKILKFLRPESTNFKIDEIALGASQLLETSPTTGRVSLSWCDTK
jgi:hypothetical protein